MKFQTMQIDKTFILSQIFENMKFQTKNVYILGGHYLIDPLISPVKQMQAKVQV